MTNREKYAKQILGIACTGNVIAVDKETLKPVNCDSIGCFRCALNKRLCRKAFKEWCDDEYVEPPVDWSKVPVDTPILVRDREDQEWKRRYFSVFRNGAVYAWKNGRTSWSAYIREDFEPWEYAKLAEDGE